MGRKVDPSSNRSLALLAEARNERTFHGSACVTCEGTLRYVEKSPNCVACGRRRSKARYHRDAEHSKALTQSYRDKDPEYYKMAAHASYLLRKEAHNVGVLAKIRKGFEMGMVANHERVNLSNDLPSAIVVTYNDRTIGFVSYINGAYVEDKWLNTPLREWGIEQYPRFVIMMIRKHNRVPTFAFYLETIDIAQRSQEVDFRAKLVKRSQLPPPGVRQRRREVVYSKLENFIGSAVDLNMQDAYYNSLLHTFED